MIWDHLRSFLVLGVSSAFTFSCVWSCPCPSSGRWFLFPLAESISEGIGWCFLVDITIDLKECYQAATVGCGNLLWRLDMKLPLPVPDIFSQISCPVLNKFLTPPWYFVIRWLQSDPLKEEGKSPLSAEFVDGTDQVANKLVDNHLSLLSTCPLHAVVKEDVAEHLKLPRTEIPMRNKCLTEYWVEQVLQTSPIHSSQGAPRPRWECSRQVSLRKSEI